MSHNRIALLLLPAILLMLAIASHAVAEVPDKGYRVDGNITVKPDKLTGLIALEAWAKKTEDIKGVDTRGGGSIVFENSKLEGNIDTMVKLYGEGEGPQMRLTLSLDFHAENYNYTGKAVLDANVSGEAPMSFHGSISITGWYSPEKNTSYFRLVMYNAPLEIEMQTPPTPPGPNAPQMPGKIEAYVDLYMESLTNLSLGKQKTSLTVRVSSRDQQSLQIVQRILATYFGLPLHGAEIKYNETRGMYYVEAVSESESEVSVAAIELQYAKGAHIDSSLVFSIDAGPGHEEGSYQSTFTVKGSIEGEVPGGVIELSDARLRMLKIGFGVSHNESHLVATAKALFDADLVDPYLAGQAVKSIVELVKNAYTGSITVYAPEPGALLVDGQLVHEARLEPREIAEKTIEYVYNGVTLAEARGVEKVYRVLTEAPAKIYARAEKVVVVAERSSSLEVYLETPAGIVSVELPKGKVVVSPAEPGAKLTGKLLVKLMEQLPKPLPENLIAVGPPIDIKLEKIPKGGLRVELPFDPAKTPADAKIAVAHFVNGEWVLVEPETVNHEEGTVVVRLETFSPLIVIAQTTAATTATTTKTEAATTTTAAAETTTTETAATTTGKTVTTVAPPSTGTETETGAKTGTVAEATTATGTVKETTTRTQAKTEAATEEKTVGGLSQQTLLIAAALIVVLLLVVAKKH